MTSLIEPPAGEITAVIPAEVAARADASRAGAMMYGPTFMGNPLACASPGRLARHDNAARMAGIEAAIKQVHG